MVMTFMSKCFGTEVMAARRSYTRRLRLRAEWLLFVLVLFQFSDGSPLLLWQPPTIFSMGPDRTIVKNSRFADISEVQTDNLTCLDAFTTSISSSEPPTLHIGGDTNSLIPLHSYDLAGRCLYKQPVQLNEALCGANMGSASSFGTMFQFQIYSEAYIGSHITQNQGPEIQGGYYGTLQGLAFIITSDTKSQGASGGYLGWLNSTTNNQTEGHEFAVEIDFFQDEQFDDPPMIHIGINKNGLHSVFHQSVPASPWQDYITRGSGSGPMEVTVWIEYDGPTQVISVTLSCNDIKPTVPFISTNVDLTYLLMQRNMFVGFSGSVTNASVPTGYSEKSGFGYVGFQITSWTFNSGGPAPDRPRHINGTIAEEIEPETKQKPRGPNNTTLIAAIASPIAATIILMLLYIIYKLWRRNSRLNALAKKYQLEDLEHLNQGPKHYKYKVLSTATKGFCSSELLGKGGFGSVYRGRLLLPGTDLKPTTVAVKRISSTSSQGAREFLAEVKIIGQVQHRNLVRLLGWCHERGELLLVYDYMPNGSVDQHLFKNVADSQAEMGEPVLTWSRRLKIVSGVATALAYLHEEWEQRVIHRDVKSSNVMLDSEFNARLGDFGLARVSEHDQAPPSTLVLAGTHGYLAPELGHTLKATEKTDVYSFGAMVLEVATGRRPVVPAKERRNPDEVLVVDWVWHLYREGIIIDAADPKLEAAFDPGEMTTLLKIGLLCCHPDPNERPNMREVLNIWKGSSPFPHVPSTKPVPIFREMDTPSFFYSDDNLDALASGMVLPSDHGFERSVPVPIDEPASEQREGSTAGSTPTIRRRPSQIVRHSPSSAPSRRRPYTTVSLPL